MVDTQEVSTLILASTHRAAKGCPVFFILVDWSGASGFSA
jgi:hypothetical protein